MGHSGSHHFEGPPPLQMERLELIAVSEEEKQSLVALFFRLAGEHIAALENAWSNSDATAWKEKAHGLKGSSANLGMSFLEECCRHAEKMKDATAQEQKEALEKIRGEVDRIRAYLASEYPSLLTPEG